MDRGRGFSLLTMGVVVVERFCFGYGAIRPRFMSGTVPRSQVREIHAFYKEVTVTEFSVAPMLLRPFPYRHIYGVIIQSWTIWHGVLQTLQEAWTISRSNLRLSMIVVDVAVWGRIDAS